MIHLRTYLPAATDWRWIAVIAVGSLLAQVLTMNADVNLYDEGLALYGGDVVAHGGIPYRDFWSLYGPAGFCVLGGVFKVFGASVLAERCVDALYRTLIVLFVFALASRLTTRSFALVATIVTLVLLVNAESYGAPIFAATACAMAAVLMTDSRQTLRSGHRWLLAGALTGLASAYRTDIGAYAFIACASGCLVAGRLQSPTTKSSRGDLATLIIAAGLVASAWIVPLLITVPLADLRNDFITIPFTVYAKNRSLPFPLLEPWRTAVDSRRIGPLIEYLVYVPLVIVAASAPKIVLCFRGSRTVTRGPDANVIESRLPLITALWALAFLLIFKGWTRVAVFHMTPALCASVVLLAWLANDIRPRRMRALAMLVLIAVAAETVTSETRQRPLRRIASSAHALLEGASIPGCEARAPVRLRCFSTDDDSMRTVAWVDGHSRAFDPIYIGSVRHDRLFVNAVSLYFFANRLSSTKWHDLHPGVQTTLEVQNEMIEEFEKRPPVLVVLDERYTNSREPNASSSSSGIHVLDDWLKARYRSAFTSGSYSVLEPDRGR